MSDEKRGGWVCRFCGSNFLLETSTGVTIKTRVDGLDGDGQVILGPQHDATGGTPAAYYCGQCGRGVVVDGRVVNGRKGIAKVLARE